MKTRDILIIAAAAVAIVMLCSFAVYNGSERESGSDYIGIIGAMDIEVDGLKDLMEIEEIEETAGMKYYKGTLYGDKIIVVQCGIGKVNAGICTQTLISKYHVKCIINTGVAGALSKDLDIGDIVISTKVLQHDFDVSPIGYKRGEIPYTGVVEFPADRGLIDKLQDAITTSVVGASVREGVICTGDQFIDTMEKKQQILEYFSDGICCEMEGGAIAQVCYLNGVPFVILRCISDNTRGDAPADYEKFKEMAAERNIAVLEQLLKDL